ncbi:hypothetical protein J6590_070628 [Homalodisca vitripennis]|nr:hypothetical protein J6590_070628 [Homalodisca vitripennis]
MLETDRQRDEQKICFYFPLADTTITCQPTEWRCLSYAADRQTERRTENVYFPGRYAADRQTERRTENKCLFPADKQRVSLLNGDARGMLQTDRQRDEQKINRQTERRTEHKCLFPGRYNKCQPTEWDLGMCRQREEEISVYSADKHKCQLLNGGARVSADRQTRDEQKLSVYFPPADKTITCQPTEW